MFLYISYKNTHYKLFRDTYIARNEAESINDHNDKCIRLACCWYVKHLSDIKIILLTDDRANREIAISENISAHTSIKINIYKIIKI